MKRILFHFPGVMSLTLGLLPVTAPGAKAQTELVVAADGSGQFTNGRRP